MASSTSHPTLFSPLKLGETLTLPNRVVMAPMSRGRATSALKANELMAEYYASRASAGLLITEGTHTSVMGRGWFHTPELVTSDDAKAWRIVTDKVHEAGGRIFCQMWHAGRASHSAFRDGEDGYEGEKKLSVAPSAIKRASEAGKQRHTPRGGEVDVETPRAMTVEEIEALPEEFRNAAQVARDGGFDGVEIHGANGFLLDTFMQSCSNHRTDQYGGSLENRFRIVDACIRAVLTVFEPECVGIRIAPNGVYNGMGSDDFRESFLYYARRFSEYKLGYMHVMIGLGFGFHNKGKPMTIAELKKEFPGPIIANVGFDADSAEKELSEGGADLVAFGRPFLSNPDLVEKMQEGRELRPMLPMEYWYTSKENVWTSEGYTDLSVMDEPVEAKE
ncbi:NADH:flavin oxidoreductase/NADH oxidase [Chondrus crispus]|uniref:NADH:flavin oxidoreductase/NADH oxidase n=1 Tax=Chondrus crispus TaxID=2769 RepID=R7QFI0_CHOCR|nr:NADH:flavin oxidoreductase/NADH oxidase [Chondrus crispus]CDF36844.1 NADH:flavin oxidoreductase/NADH oxidase [Chondrus crispus]|eukprot:XP_005716663.1 NADH:flavin oxidoreductase/NADH oxidase [Chondrus crispus]